MGLQGPFFVWDFPYRHPDLPRFARTTQFRELRSAAADWIEQQFARVRQEAEWLTPVARLVSDYGTISGTSYRRKVDFGAILRVRLGVFATLRFQRQVAVAFGFGGAATSRILELTRVLEQAGWEPRLYRSRYLTHPERIREIPAASGAAYGHWPGPLLERPDGGGPPHFGPAGPSVYGIHVAWTTRADRVNFRLEPAYPPPQPVSEPRASYVPLEFSGPLLPTGFSEFAGPALDRHEHVVTVMIELGYYAILPTTRAGPVEVPRRPLPRLG